MGFLTIVGVVLPLLAGIPAAETVSLFDAEGRPAAYLLGDRIICLWSGYPAAVLRDDPAGGFHIYGYDTGRHLGWFVDGFVRDHRGYRVGAVKEKFPGLTEPAPPTKPALLYTPSETRQSPPDRPPLVEKWSYISLELFLQQGSVP